MAFARFDTHQAQAQRRLDLKALEADLRREVDGEVGFDTGSRALYATDASNYRRVPICVVVPRSVEALARAVTVAARHGAPVLHRGGGTSLAGQCANEAVVIDSSRWCDRVLAVVPAGRRAVVEPGTILDTLQAAVRPHGLRFGPDPSTHDHNTLGGMIGNNSAGVHSVVGGKTVDNVLEMEVMTYDGLRLKVGPTPEDELAAIIASGGRRGAIYGRLRALRDRYAPLIRERFPAIPRRVSGYNLDQLLPESGFDVARALVGTEGTCVSVLNATLRLIPDPAHKVLLAIGFDDICRAADFVPRLLEFGPDGIEGIDRRLVDNMKKKDLHPDDVKLLPGGDNWLLVEFGGDTAEEAADKARRVMDDLGPNRAVQDMRLMVDPRKQKRLWLVRESGLGGTAFVPGQERDTWPGWEDSAVDPARLGDYLRDLYDLYDRYGYHGAMYGHFGDGLVHTRIDFNLHTDEDVRRMRAFLFEAAELVRRHDGSNSGEHGDGQARSELLERMFGPEIIQAFREFKAIWDPHNKMNPGIVVDPRPLDADLRLGPRFNQRAPGDTWFSYAEEGGDFTRAALRCVGVGKCRRREGGTMCPSYKATLDERHSTRGRAHLLQEMLQGDPIRDGWASEAVHSALDLCLSCKGCKSDCPVNVDMATYKAEFMAHHYAGKMRPRAAYSMGRIHRWARMLAPVPWAPNLGTGLPVFGRMSREVAGIHPDRPVPTFAARTFRSGFAERPGPGPLVVLWTDTFSNHFEPGPLHGALALLRAAGCDVRITKRDACCGRPLYDFGWLDEARDLLLDCLEELGPALDAGAWVVGVEPSCVTTFKDELLNLFPNDPRAKVLAERTLMLDRFLLEVLDWHPPRLQGPVVVHGHCYQKSVLGLSATAELLRRAGAEPEVADSGCCGMAGAFGYETRKYDVSRAIYAQAWEPSVRNTPGHVPIVADGFSCRCQVKQLGGRTTVTLPELLAGMSRR